MNIVKRITAKMIPVIENRSGKSMVGDIGSVPAVRVSINFDSMSQSCIGLIDTGSDICVIDESLFNKFSESKKIIYSAVKVKSNFLTKTVPIYYMNINILGDDENQILSFNHVPVIVTNLNRQVFIIGRRNVLEWLKIELDFPKGLLKLTRSQLSDYNFPAMSNEFPSLDTIIESFEKKELATGVMKLSWEMERYLDRLISADNELINAFKEVPYQKMTLGQKFNTILKVKNLKKISKEINNFVAFRNTIAHSRDERGLKRIKPKNILSISEKIVLILSKKQKDIT